MNRKRVERWIRKVGGLSLGRCQDRRLIESQFTAMARLIPGLYLILIVNLIGILLVAGRDSLAHPLAWVLLVALTLRFFVWHYKRQWRPRGLTALREMRTMVVNSAILPLLHTALIASLYFSGAPTGVVVLGIFSAFGAHFAMGIFPGASRLPILFLGVPMAALLLLGPGINERLMGLALLTLLLLSTRINRAIARTFADQVSARDEARRERHRARGAEQLALAERAAARRQSLRDPLTALANRRALVEALTPSLHSSPDPVALLLIDLDGFKPVNDTFGHNVGDELLCSVARRLQRLAGRARVVARLGGDEFAVLIDDERATAEGAATLATLIVDTLAEPYAIGDRTIAVSACCGHALSGLGTSPSQLMREADLALYQAKRRGHNSTSGFSPALQDQVERRTALECALRMPGVEREIELAYQPIVCLADGRITAFEALARWRHSELGPIPPGEFIQISEQILVIERLSDALLTAAATAAARWPEPIRLSFNLSALQLCTPNLERRLVALVEAAGLPPRRLQIEVTETAMMQDLDLARANLLALRAAGVCVALDDFGAGFASVSYLKTMAFDAVKLDGSLVDAAPSSPRAAALLRGVIALCRGLDMPCVAEHVGSEAQARMLIEMGCTYGQGYWLGRPVDALEAAAMAGAAERIDPPGRLRAIRR